MQLLLEPPVKVKHLLPHFDRDGLAWKALNETLKRLHLLEMRATQQEVDLGGSLVEACALGKFDVRYREGGLSQPCLLDEVNQTYSCVAGLLVEE